MPQRCTEPSANGTNKGCFLLIRDADTSRALTVNFSIGGTATNKVNYEDISATSITIAAGSRTNMIAVTPKQDGVDGADKTVTLTLTDNLAYSRDPNSSAATITIANVSTNCFFPTVTVVASTNDAREANLKQGAFLFTRTGPTTNTLRVYYQTSGTATPETDYRELPGFVDIPAGQSNATVSVVPYSDSERELTETVIVTLIAGNYRIGSSHRDTVYIDDNNSTTYTFEALRSYGIYDASKGQPTIIKVTRSGSALLADSLAFTMIYTLSGNTLTGYEVSGDVRSTNVTWAAHQSVAKLYIKTYWQNYSDTAVTPSIKFPTVNNAIALHYLSPAYLVSAPAVTLTGSQVLEGNTLNIRFKRPYPNANSLTAVIGAITGLGGGTAQPGTDISIPSSITFPANTSYIDVPVKTYTSSATTGWKSIVIGLSDGPNAVPLTNFENTLV